MPSSPKGRWDRSLPGPDRWGMISLTPALPLTEPAALNQLPALTVFIKAALPLYFLCHCFLSLSLSPPVKVSSMWKVFSFWINPEAHSLILWRTQADLPQHSPLSEFASSELPLPCVFHDSENGPSCTLLLLRFIPLPSRKPTRAFGVEFIQRR